ncbi:uncharacterized protein LOC111297757 [Durio zibethinus]|uniref:Uncharacterized protein LOC111297757 n=1 Tax=Durio zibethinus TaxID=66656 RepID=A0A6P5Z6E4_DURZI|nr:uncharacterized protein LOC111297757 [Durio zibethinus]
MAPTPAVQFEAGALVSTPSQLQRNSATKRDKTVVAAYPISIKFSTDIPEYTECILENFSEEDLHLDDRIIWEGSKSKHFPTEIPKGEMREFKHEADFGCPVVGSVVGLEYVFGEGNKYKWIIAWSNSKNELNKVYTEIIEDEVADWDKIKLSLEKSGQHSVAEKHQFLSEIVIDPTSATPTMKATFKLLLLVDDKPTSTSKA